MQGIPLAFVNAISLIFYKKLGWSNAQITFLTSLFLFPWTIKFLIAPLLESSGTKRNWILKTQSIFIFLLLCFTALLQFKPTSAWSALLFFAIAINAAIHDTVSDGLYIDYLSTDNQAKYVSVTSIAYHSGVLICKTGFIYGLGFLLEKSYPQSKAWCLPLLSLSVLVLFLLLWNQYTLPREHMHLMTTQKNKILKTHFIRQSYQTIWQSFQSMPHLYYLIAFALLYHFPELQLMKIMPLFLLDKTNQGGLQLSLQETGFIYGGLGTFCSLIGMSMSGWMLHRWQLKHMMLPITVLTALGNGFSILGFFLCSHTIFNISLFSAAIYFFFGFSNCAYILYLMSSVKGHAGMSLYALASSFSLFATLISGSFAGKMQMLLGYPLFFGLAFLLSLGLIILVKMSLHTILS